MRNIIVIACAAVILGAGSTALSQPGQADEQPALQIQERPADAPAADVQPTAGLRDQPVGTTTAPVLQAGTEGQRPAAIRQQCETALRADAEWRAELKGQLARSILSEPPEAADAQWRAELKQQLASEVHAEDANLMLTNRKHVVMAYAALWMLVVFFVVLMWLKQQGLKAEIARLETEIREATQDDKAG